MEFALTEEQRLFADSLRSLLTDQLPIEALRRHADIGSGFDAELWDSLVELGLPGLLVPERFGGAGLGVLDAAVAAEVL
ncbi:MAG: acyl-CoA dehydrogenase family protein, partial [Acetobacteraceae bacterium]